MSLISTTHGTNSSHRKRVDLLWSYTSVPYLKLFRTTGSLFNEVTFNGSIPSEKLNIIKYSPDGKYILCGRSASPYFTGYYNNENYDSLGSLSNSPLGSIDRWGLSIRYDSKQFATYTGGNLSIYTLPGLQREYLDFFSGIDRLKYSNHSNKLAVGQSSFIRIYNTDDFTYFSINASDFGTISDFFWSKDDDYLIIVGNSGNKIAKYNFNTTGLESDASNSSLTSLLVPYVSKDNKTIMITRSGTPGLETFDLNTLLSKDDILDNIPSTNMIIVNESTNSKYLTFSSTFQTPYSFIYNNNTLINTPFTGSYLTPWGIGLS